MTYQEVRPAPALRPFVQSLWTLTGTQAEPGFELILPDGHAELIIHRGDPFRQRLSSGRLRVQSTAMIAGQMESGVAVAPGRAVETIGVKFAPCGLAPLCDVPQHTLTDLLLDVGDVAGPRLRRLVARAGAAASLPDALRLLHSGLLHLFAAAPPPHPRLQSAVAGILRSGGDISMDRLHAAVGTSPRWLERRFRDDVGVAPKRLARLVRFQRALGALVTAPARSCASLAVEHGYYDQAHFTADFHAFTGHAPREFVRDRLDELTRAFVAVQPPGRH
jgi:AraC-like DNA-binding protein